VPNFFWTISLLLVLAVVSCFAVELEVVAGPLVDAKQLLLCIHDRQQAHYAATAFQLISQRVESWRQNGGSGHVGIYLQEVDSGFELGYDAWRTMLDGQGEFSGFYHTASVAKLLIAHVCFWLDDQGVVSLDQSIYDQVTATQYQLRPLIRRMLTHSVNLYHNVLLRWLGSELANDTLAKLNLLDSRLSRELAWAPGTSQAT
jgi:beta-lactamase class A